VLEVSELSMAYGPIEVVHNLCLAVGDGEIVTISPSSTVRHRSCTTSMGP